jgi:hypothetical protein
MYQLVKTNEAVANQSGAMETSVPTIPTGGV